MSRSRLTRGAVASLFLLAAVLQSGAPAARATFPGSTTGLIAFTRNDGSTSHLDLWTMHPDGTGQAQLTSTPDSDFSAAWSPDGTKIAFVRSPASSDSSQIWVMDAGDPSSAHAVTSDPGAFDAGPSWSPDGTTIAFSSTRDAANPANSTDSEIYSIHADGSNLAQLTNDTGNASQPDWSPDGTKIAFTAFRPGGGQQHFDIWAMNSDGTAEAAVTPDSSTSNTPAWWPDGSKIVYSSNPLTQGSSYDLWTIQFPVGAATPVQLFTTPANESDPSPTPDGTAIFFDTNGPPPPRPNGAAQTGADCDTVSSGGTGGVIIDDDCTQPAVQTPAPCEASVEKGWMELTQGVWPDDQVFKNKVGKQIVRVGKNLEQELPMVVNRSTLLFGTYHPEGEGVNDRRKQIIVDGVAYGTTPVDVKMNFFGKFNLGSGFEVLYDSPPVGSIMLDPPCTTTPQPFHLVLDAPNGIPPSFAFQFDYTGKYVLFDRIFRTTNRDTGLSFNLQGDITITTPPKVLIVPVVLKELSGAERDVFQLNAKGIADEVRRRTQDFWPIPSGSMKVDLQPIVDLTNTLKASYTAWADFALKYLSHFGLSTRKNIIVAELDHLFEIGGFVSKADRLVVVLPLADYNDTLPPSSGMASSKMDVFVTDRAHVDDVDHELVHTLPYLWTDPHMFFLCGKDYHNTKDLVANGYQVTLSGTETRADRDGKATYMGAPNPDWWTDQCTFWHLQDVLHPYFDPSVLLVSGRLVKDGSRIGGELLPSYQIAGHADLQKGAPGSLAIVLRNAKGGQIARYGFDPQFASDRGARDVRAFAFRVPMPAGLATIELVGQKGVLSRKRLSPHAPSVNITSPAGGAQLPGSTSVKVSWHATDADRDHLLATVLYSPDGGATWFPQAVERSGSSFTVTLDPSSTNHMVQVIVTDGGRSDTAQVSFTT